MLAARGFHVVRFDNRDVGPSTKIEGGPRADVMAALAGDTSSASYTLDDMADDCVGLLDHLGVDAAHLVGRLAGRDDRPDAGDPSIPSGCCRSPRSCRRRATRGGPAAPGGDAGAARRRRRATATASPSSRCATWRVIGSPGFEADEERAARSGAGELRPRHPLRTGTARQLVAILASGDRTEALRRLDLPTLVIHGDGRPADRRLRGEATAAAIPGAELVLIDGMGHDLPRPLWPRFVDLIVANAQRAQAPLPPPTHPSSVSRLGPARIGRGIYNFRATTYRLGL